MRLRAYNYDGSTFTNTAHNDDWGSVREITVSADGTMFLSSRDEGLITFEYSPIQSGTFWNGKNHLILQGVVNGILM